MTADPSTPPGGPPGSLMAAEIAEQPATRENLPLGGGPAAAQGLPEAEKTPAGAVAARYRFAGRLVTTGRGYPYPAAYEGAPKHDDGGRGVGST